MTDRNEPAFPVMDTNRAGELYCMCPGLTKREWFAGQAMAGLGNGATIEPSDDLSWEQVVARLAYRVADAMLAEGSKPENRDDADR